MKTVNTLINSRGLPFGVGDMLLLKNIHHITPARKNKLCTQIGNIKSIYFQQFHPFIYLT